MKEEKKPIVKLTGRDGNAFAILGAVSKALKKAGWEETAREKVLEEMRSGDYDNLLATAEKYCDVRQNFKLFPCR